LQRPHACLAQHICIDSDGQVGLHEISVARESCRSYDAGAISQAQA
jgi:hypothetical protein